MQARARWLSLPRFCSVASRRRVFFLSGSAVRADEISFSIGNGRGVVSYCTRLRRRQRLAETAWGDSTAADGAVSVLVSWLWFLLCLELSGMRHEKQRALMHQLVL